MTSVACGSGSQAYILSVGGLIYVYDAGTNNVTTTFQVTIPGELGPSLQDITVNHAGTTAYATELNNVIVIDTRTNKQTAVIPVAAFSFKAVVNPSDTRVYVVGSNVSVIDTATNKMTTTIPISGNGIAINRKGDRVYVTGGNISVIDTATNKVTTTIPVSGDDVAVDPTGTKLYVTHGGDVYVVSTLTNKVIAKIPIGLETTKVAVNPEGTRAYVLDLPQDPMHFPGNLSVIDTKTNKVIAKLTMGPMPNDISLNPTGTKAYVTILSSGGFGASSVAIIDTKTNQKVGGSGGFSLVNGISPFFTPR
ncbi:MAG TPA: YncE family protein [Methanocella sp.]|nr:YncE family protein [Methanocella sp.]